MKLKKLLLFCSLVLSLFSCGPVELDNIEAFEYTFPGLEEVEPLPEVVLTVPAEVKVTVGNITVPEEADELVTTVTDGEIPEENLAVIETFSEISPEVSSQEIIESVTEEWIQGVLDGTIIPSDNLTKIADEFKSDPELVKFFSRLELPKVDGVTPGGRLVFPTDTEGQVVLDEVLRSFALIGPCKETAEKIYLENVGILEADANSQLAKSKAFYDNLRTGFVALYNQSLAQKDQIISTNVNELKVFLIDFNESVDALDYSDEVKRGLKIYVISFAIELSDQVEQWENAFILTAETARDKRVDAANKDQATADATIRASLKAALAEQTSSFQEAVDSCHNQGAGG